MCARAPDDTRASLPPPPSPARAGQWLPDMSDIPSGKLLFSMANTPSFWSAVWTFLAVRETKTTTATTRVDLLHAAR